MPRPVLTADYLPDRIDRLALRLTVQRDPDKRWRLWWRADHGQGWPARLDGQRLAWPRRKDAFVILDRHALRAAFHDSRHGGWVGLDKATPYPA